jgi:acyl dehydratase
VTVKVGDRLPPFRRTTDLETWNRFAAVNDEFFAIHMDDEAGRAAGYPTALGMGNLQWSYLHNVLRGWIGDRGRILRLSCRFAGPNTRGMVVIATGVVTAVREEADSQEIDLEVWTEDGDGGRLAPGTATVVLGP